MPISNEEDDKATLRQRDGAADDDDENQQPAARRSAGTNSSENDLGGLDLDSLQKINHKRVASSAGWWAWIRSSLVTFKDVELLSARREASRNLCAYLVGLVACWLAVTVVAVVHTGFEYTPLFFLSIAEYDAGEIDVRVTAGGWTRHKFLNFSKFASEIGGRDSYFSYVAPRHEFAAFLWAHASCDPALNVSDLEQRYQGPSAGEPCADVPYSPSEGCVGTWCGGHTSAWLLLLDEPLEQRMGLGRHWPHGAVPPGEVMLQTAVAKALKVEEGEWVTLMVEAEDYVRAAVSLETLAGMVDDSSHTSLLHSTFYVNLRVAAVFNSTHGKLDQEETAAALVDYRSFLRLIAAQAHPAAAPTVGADLLVVEPFDFAESLACNLPAPRVQTYMSNDFEVVKKAVLVFASRVVAQLGPENVNAEVLLLGALEKLRVLSLFLALVTSIIMSGLCGLLCLLIYSLLIVSVETRTFDLGVLRMVGMRRSGVVRLLLVQCLSYAVPAWALGMLASHYLADFSLRYLGELVGAVIEPQLRPTSVAYATAMGLVVPMLSAVLPIRKALSATLQDALDVNRNKVQAIHFSIERAGSDRPPIGMLAGGSVLAALGVVVYYLFPRALLEFNLSLLLYIFFGLLVAMIGGLTVLALNLERPVEHLLAVGLLLWNSRAVTAVMHKNLTAHRKRNRKTTLMYALSLAFIIFVIKTFELQISTFKTQEQQRLGAPFRLTCERRSSSSKALAAVDAFMQDQQGEFPLVQDVGFITHRLADVRGASTYLSTLGSVYESRMHVVGVTPNLFGVILPGLSTVRERRLDAGAWLVTEELYTAHGSQGAVLGTLYQEQTGLKLNQSCLLQTRMGGGTEVRELAPMAFLDGMAGLLFSPYPGASVQDALVSLPTFLRLTNGAVKSMADVPIHRALFQVRADATEEELEELQSELVKLAGNSNCDLDTIWDRTRGLEVAISAMDFFAAGTTAIALLISFFSLISSMVANIHEQAKEIGLLRALGVKKGWLRRIYTMEAVVLVLSAGALGVGIGSLVAYTISAQRALITQLPLPFDFPTVPALVLVATSIISAFFAAFLPALRLARTNIVKLMRKG